MKVNGEEVPVEIVEETSQDGTVKLKIEVDKVDADMSALIYVGPMERDVEFKVIPKMETLTLIEAIEEVEEIPAEDEEVSVEEETLAVVAEDEKNNNITLIIAGVVAIVAIGAIVIVKAKKK